MTSCVILKAIFKVFNAFIKELKICSGDQIAACITN